MTGLLIILSGGKIQGGSSLRVAAPSPRQRENGGGKGAATRRLGGSRKLRKGWP